MFIVFEGLDKSGKTTLLNKFKDYLEKQEYKVTVLDTKSKCLNREDRIECFWNEDILKRSEVDRNNNEYIILSDRYFPSWIVYESKGDYYKYKLLYKRVREALLMDKLRPFTLGFYIYRDINKIKELLSDREKKDIKDISYYHDLFLELTNNIPRFKSIYNRTIEEALENIIDYWNAQLLEYDFLYQLQNIILADTMSKVNIIVYGEEGSGKSYLVAGLSNHIYELALSNNYKPLILQWDDLKELDTNTKYDFLIVTLDDATYMKFSNETKREYVTLRHKYPNVKKIVVFFITHRYWDLDKVFRNTFQYLIVKSSPSNLYDVTVFKKLLGDIAYEQLNRIDKLRYAGNREAFNYFIYSNKFGEVKLGRYEPYLLTMQ